MALRRIGKPNFGSAIEVFGLFYIQGLAAFFLIAPLASLSAPLADSSLARADEWLGFDWFAYAKITAPFDLPLAVAYRSFAWQPALTALTLFLRGQQERGWQTLTAAVVALLITSLIFPFVPAQGSVIHYGATIPYAPHASRSAHALLALKAGQHLLDSSVFTALIAFPSYHSVAAVVFTWACWRSPLRWLVLILNLLLIASALTIGGHFLVDIFAGIAVGIVSIFIASRLVRSHSPLTRTHAS